MLKTIITQIQIAFYFEEKIKQPVLLGAKIIDSNLKKYFNAPPVLQSFPDNNEFDEFQSVLLTSTEGDRLTISKKRADIYFDGKKRKIDQMMQEILEKSEEFFMCISKENKVGRLGFVVSNAIEVKNPEKMLAKFLSIEPLKLPGGDSIHSGSIKYVTKDKINKIDIHNVTQMETGNVTFADGEKIRGILLVRDFNIPETTSLNWEIILNFIQVASKSLMLDNYLTIIEND